MTVSRVINNSGYVSKKTRAKVEQAIRDLDYVPNAVARSLRVNRTNTIAFLTGDLKNPFWTSIAEGAQQIAHEAQLRMILCNTGNSLDDQREYLELVVEQQIDGILLHPLPHSEDMLRWVQAHKIPVVTIDLGVDDVDVDYVHCDSEAGAYQMVRLLIELGHERIALISGVLEFSTMQDRMAGYRRALAEFGLQDNEAIYHDWWDGASGYRMAQQALQVDPRPTALFATSNFLGYGALRCVRDQGLRIPEDITVVSFDELPGEINFDPYLTLVAQPALQMGQRASALLIDRIKGEVTGPAQNVILPTELRLRRSSGPPPR